jgi:hypothetical protein
MHIDNDPGLRLNARGKRVAIAVIVIGLLLLFALALTDRAGAADLSGNRGGCAEVSKRSGLRCTVQDAGVGWVSGTCLYGEYFLAQTARTFRSGESVTVQGCIDNHATLYSAPGWPLRIRKQ